MNFIKGAGNLEADFRYTNFFLASDPPTGGGGFLLNQQPAPGLSRGTWRSTLTYNSQTSDHVSRL